MASKISASLQQQLEDAKSADPEREIGVIITVTRGADLSLLRERGLRLVHVYRNISAVSGVLSASSAESLAQLDEIELMEPDGKAHALSD